MTIAIFPDAPPLRPLWLITLADLALLLLGFFVLVAAHQGKDRAALAEGVRRGFGGNTAAAAPVPAPRPAPDPIPLAAAALYGFAPASATLPEPPAALIAWAREAARDDRVQVRITGLADGTPSDRDPLSGSATLLAADRARAVALALNQAGVLPGDRIAIATALSPGRRGVLLTMSFAGNRQNLAGRQCRHAGCAETTADERTDR